MAALGRHRGTGAKGRTRCPQPRHRSHQQLNMTDNPTSIEDTASALLAHGYVAQRELATATFLALRLQRAPMLGPLMRAMPQGLRFRIKRLLSR